MRFYQLFIIVLLSSFLSCNSKVSKASLIPEGNFNTQIDGQKVALYTLTNENGMTVQITNYGARVVALWVPDKKGNFQDVVWGYNSIDEYLASTDIYCGPIVGRFGNRINKGLFTLNDSIYQLTINNNDNHLHGGTNGFYKKVWNANPVLIDGNSALELTHFSKDGEEGYPGNLTLKVTYIITKNNELKLLYAATTDKPTIINPTSHCYFNLTGSSQNSILDHILQINSKEFTPTIKGLIPTGELEIVKNTPFDFTTPTAIGARIDVENEQLAFGKGYDHNFVIDKKLGAYEQIAQIYAPKSGILMSIKTDQPGLQFYSGNFMKGKLMGKRGDMHNYRSGIALEAQNFPDAPNHTNFPSAVLLPSETYTQTTSYTFSIFKN